MDPYEEARVKNKHIKLLNKLKRKSKFTLKELEILLLIHYQMKDYATLDRGKFKAYIHNALDMTDTRMGDRLYGNFDSRDTNWISIKDFIRGMGILLRGTQREQADFCFAAYDTFGANKLTRDSMYHLLRKCIILAPSEDDAEEGAKDLVEVLFKFCDQDNDGSINLDEFRAGVSKEPLLMETLGPCLPDRPARDAFLTAFAQKPPTYY